MGCDYFADDNGKFILVVRDYKTGKDIDFIELHNLEPGQELSVEIEAGTSR